MADISTTRRLGKARRHFRIRKRVTGTAGASAPGGHPLDAAHHRAGRRRPRRPHAGQRLDAGGGPALGESASGDKSALARQVGALVAERAKAQGVTAVVFDRGGNRYHGRIAALADGARESGLEF